MKLIILAIIFYLLYRSVKKWMAAGSLSGPEKPAGHIDDIMVKDPYCQTYFPERQGFPLSWEGKDLLFCCAECRDKFVGENKGEIK